MVEPAADPGTEAILRASVHASRAHRTRRERRGLTTLESRVPADTTHDENCKRGGVADGVCCQVDAEVVSQVAHRGCSPTFDRCSGMTSGGKGTFWCAPRVPALDRHQDGSPRCPTRGGAPLTEEGLIAHVESPELRGILEGVEGAGVGGGGASCRGRSGRSVSDP